MGVLDIKTELEWSERWGCNNQPYLEEMVEHLSKMPLTRIYMDDEATLVLDFQRPLTATEAWYLCYYMSADEPYEYDGGTKLRLWWD